MTKDKGEFELWKTVRGEQKLLGTYTTAAQLQRSWRKHYDGFALRAYRIVGGKRVDIGDMMPKKYAGLSEYTSPEERDSSIIAMAEYFTIVRFLGVGQYERHERKTRREAKELGNELASKNKANYMIYAVTPTGRTAFVETCFGYI